METMKIAEALYGSGWGDLHDWLRDDAAGFVPELLDLNAADVINGFAFDRASECADAAVPIYRADLLGLLADVSISDDVLRAVDDLGGLGEIRDCDRLVERVASLGYYGLVSNVFAAMLDAIETAEGFAALGLDADAAEVAVALLPEWSGTVGELVEAAPHLAADTLAVTR